MIQKTGLGAFTEFHRPSVVAVGVPLMIAAGIATYFNSRASVARQSPEAAANPQTAMMNKLALYVFPLGVVVGGPFLPLAIILYWFANNIWTFGQQHYVFGKIEKEEEAKKLAAIERRAANAPAPGAKPKRKGKVEPAAGGDGAAAADGAGVKNDVTPEITESTGSELTDGERKPRPGATPRPGARPKKRKR
jgi:YidC/Oxa1 family membrane protein insertase